MIHTLSDQYQNLVFYDYKAGQQRYYCEAPGCAHNTPSCTSYLDTYGGVAAFRYGVHLYINYAMYNNGTPDRNQWPSALVCYHANGTGGGEVMLTYPSCELQVGTVYCDGQALYFEAPDGLVALDLATFEKRVVTTDYQFTDFSEANKQQGTFLLPCLYGDEILCLRETVTAGQGRTLEQESYLFSLCVQTGQETPLHTFPPGQDFPDRYTPEGKGYYVTNIGEVRCFDISTGQHSLVTDLLCPLATSEQIEHPGLGGEEGVQETFYAASSWNVAAYGDWLLVNLWEPNAATGEPEDYTWSYNLATGAHHKLSYGSFFNGYVHPMMVWGETPYGLLVIEDHHKRLLHTTGTGGDPYTVDSEYWVFALAPVDGFARDEADFYTLAPVGYSGA